MPHTYHSNESKGRLFRYELLKSAIDRELRENLAELLSASKEDIAAAFRRVIQDLNPKLEKLMENETEEDAFALKIICSVFTVADCNSVFPADFDFALALLEADGTYSYCMVKRSKVAKIDLDDGLMRAPVCRADSKGDFEAGFYKIGWFVEENSPPA